MVLDASAIVAVLTSEPERDAILETIDAAAIRLIPAFAIYEASLAVARRKSIPVDLARADVRAFAISCNATIAPVGEDEANAAVSAHMRFGKGTGHPARLNMGDCFAYAVAKTRGLPLLFKGEDFALTDIKRA
jgi:ribonuclease VapC